MDPTPFASFLFVTSKRSACMYPACLVGLCRSMPAALMRSAHPKARLSAFAACTMMSLRNSLRRGSVWIDHSMRFRDGDQMLIPAKEWERDRVKYLGLLGLPVAADTFIEQLMDTLRAGVAAVAEACAQGKIERCSSWMGTPQGIPYGHAGLNVLLPPTDHCRPFCAVRGLTTSMAANRLQRPLAPFAKAQGLWIKGACDFRVSCACWDSSDESSTVSTIIVTI